MVDIITYRTDDETRWGDGKGANLTPAEVDLSFWSIHVRVLDLEENPSVAVGISNIVQTGSTFTVHLEDATIFGPFTLPRAVQAAPVVEIGAADIDSDGIFFPTLQNAGQYLRVTAAGGCIVLVPDEGAVAFPIDTEIHFRQCTNAGQVSIEGGSAVIINGRSGRSHATAVRGSVITLKKVAADEWDLFGDLAEESTG